MLAKEGIVASVVCTTIFAPFARQLARTYGTPELPILILPHPVQLCTPAELQAAIARIAGELVDHIKAQKQGDDAANA